MDAELRSRVAAWRDQDPDAQTRAEVEALLLADDEAALRDRFDQRLTFGTAGLRGALGAGPNRMNRAVVTRTAAGLAAYLRGQGKSAVVVGYDARHQSDVFARDTAQVLAGAGLAPMVLPHPLPTPVLAFAIRHLGAGAGVMVTASHNPPQDNGYKVYLGDGSQIVPPVDAEIARLIDAVGPCGDVPRGEQWVTLDDDVTAAYLNRAASLVPVDAPRDLRIAYTPLHGVGGRPFRDAFVRSGFDEPEVTAEQWAPDPDFPTVAFPNPEEPGALDLALARAREVHADLLIANDPDADRCSVAVPQPDGRWRPLTGDEVGGLLGEFLARQRAAGTFATTLVSSSRLARIAAEHGLRYEQTLTGFKWIGRVPDLAFGYEEALGYCVDPRWVADKDGITAALRIAEMAARLKAAGRTLLDALDDLDRTYGVHQTGQVSIRSRDAAALSALVSGLLAAPPPRIGGLVVHTVEDLSTGVDGLPPTDGARFALAGPSEGGSARLVIRPSGTEPKLKAYLEVVVPVFEADLAGARGLAAAALAALQDDVRRLLADPSTIER